jgi:DNA topoisomerase-1
MAGKTLVVVESPAKAKTINKYLGKDYIVESSVGHIKNLVTFGLGVDIKNGFTPKYQTIRGKAATIKKLKDLAKKTKAVLIATDPDREGEAIANHIAEEIKDDNKDIKRILFNEITKNGVLKGLAEPREINYNLCMAQQARRIMDRLIGFKVSPFLSKTMLTKTSGTLSAGRVQSVALRLIVEREKEIRDFLPIDYWSIAGDFLSENQKNFKARLVSVNKTNLKNPEGSAKSEDNADLDKRTNFIKSEEQALDLITRIKQNDYKISDITKKSIKRNPSAPLTTSALQQEASKKLGLSNSRTMLLAQQLYEGVNLGSEGQIGLITYMRTDSTRLSPEAELAAKEHIQKTFGPEYVPDYTPKYTGKSKNVQDAHEAIRPTSLTYTPDYVRQHLDKAMSNLYELVYNTFLASQMAPAIIDQTTVNIKGGEFGFRASGSVVAFKGFLALFDNQDEEPNEEESEKTLPSGLAENQKADLKNVDSTKSSTKPKARYTEASLIKELDEKGIGRPSTYAGIVSTLVDREYVDLAKRTFTPTDLGMQVSDVLFKSFQALFNVTFTAGMEEELDQIADGDKDYVKVMTDFYGPFTETLTAAEKSETGTQIPCQKCGAQMQIRVSRKGRFLGCTNYPECDHTEPLPKGENEAKKAEPQIAEGIFCDICGKPMNIRESRYGKFYGCSDYPTCKSIKKIGADKPKPHSDVNCPKCKEGQLTERYSKKTRKKFWSCSTYPTCDYLTNHEPYNKKCGNCESIYLNIHFKKDGEDWKQYLKCPDCKTDFEMPEEAK